MSIRFDCAEASQRTRGIARAAQAVQAGELVVLPTDTVYGIGCDAFSADAVAGLLAAKGRGRAAPPAVLVPHLRTLDGLADRITPEVRELVGCFWPGPLTLVCHAHRTLDWDLGDAGDTVALRMPLHPVALELLGRTGPMAVTGANLGGRPAATRCDEAEGQFGDRVTVYLDGGPGPTPEPSTILDVTGDVPRVLRLGALGADRLRQVVPDLDAGDAGDAVAQEAGGPA